MECVFEIQCMCDDSVTGSSLLATHPIEANLDSTSQYYRGYTSQY